ncbi:hypothetical protein HCN44_005040 [Aphidius gifuensis]|uniref:MICOS complex subunit MIC10 n=1 Tax=Aphidius gifuensis TaxID=684658 RepID=A0A834XTW3_APHGI|nr:MICOS complex subunit Mic10-like [Aphidius gifuensis]KAF7992696.1 hypothetical protein HCN44_005040 [Aphidius gifuensis]
MAGTWSEDQIGRKWDHCFADAVIKLGGGIVVGSVVSLLFFRRRWPIVVGGGFGLGMAFSNCENEINATVKPGKLLARNCDDSKKPTAPK